jgi:hypothetical protein
VLYGNSAAVNPSTQDSTYDDEKPIFDLVNSTNDTWIYDENTGFYDASKPNRTGSWKPAIVKSGTESETYHVKGNVETGDPAMGMRAAAWLKGTKIAADTVTISWQMNCPGLISEVSATGRKYRSGTQWPSTKAFRMERSKDQKTWYEVWYEPTPSTAATFEAWTKNTQAITPNMANVRFLLLGTVPAVADLQVMAEILTCTVEFVSGNLPVGSFLGEKSNYLLDVTLTNQTTGDVVYLKYPMLLNTLLSADGESFEVVYGDVNAHSALSLDDDSRAIWMRLAPGSNTIEITGNDMGILDGVLRWYERRR